jgi:hypothetical protein
MTEPDRLTLEEAAELLGISPDQLNLTRHRGLAPGKYGYKEGGVVVFNRADLQAADDVEAVEKPKPKKKAPAKKAAPKS